MGTQSIVIIKLIIYISISHLKTLFYKILIVKVFAKFDQTLYSDPNVAKKTEGCTWV